WTSVLDGTSESAVPAGAAVVVTHAVNVSCFGSGAGLSLTPSSMLTVAEFVMPAGGAGSCAGTCTRIGTLICAPLASDPKPHLVPPSTGEHVPTLGLADTNVPTATVSVSVTCVALLFPWLVMSTV